MLIDPPFERRDEYERIFDAAVSALRKWPGGIFMSGSRSRSRRSPAPSPRVAAQAQRIPEGRPPGRNAGAGRPLAQTGLVVVNPPYVLEEEMNILPVLARPWRAGQAANFWIESGGRQRTSFT